MTQNKYEIKEIKQHYPWILREIFKGKHGIITHKGEEICAVIPVKDLLRYEGLELEKLEKEDISEAVKEVMHKIYLKGDL